MSTPQIVRAPRAGDVVLDACVLVDMIIADRPRHATAAAVARTLRADEAVAFVPAHGMFEFIAATSSEHRARGRPLRLGHKIGFAPVDLIEVPVDTAALVARIGEFGDKLLGLRGGDMIYLFVALHEQLPLLTEDDLLHEHAEAAGVQVYRSAEYLDARGRNP